MSARLGGATRLRAVARLTHNELLAMLGGVLLARRRCSRRGTTSVSPLASLAGYAGVGELSAWQAHAVLRWLLLLVAIAPFVLAYIIVRDHQLRGRVAS